MDPPSEAIKHTTTTSVATATSDSPSVEESPFSNYVSNLSPINSVKASHGAQGFLGINSPPLVFTSPHLVAHRASFVERSQYSQESRVEVGKNNCQSKKLADDPHGLEKSACNPKVSDSKNPVQDQPRSSSGCLDEYLSDPVEVDGANYMNFGNPQGEQSNDVLQSSVTNLKETLSEANQILNIGASPEATQILSEHAEEEPQEQSTLAIVAVIEEEQKNGGEHPTTDAESFVDHASYEEQSETLGAQASILQRGMSRRCLQFGGAIPPPYGARSPFSVSKPSGIGLHLNSIANALPLGHRVTATIKAAPILSCQIVEDKSSSANLQNFVENVLLISEDWIPENKDSPAAFSETLQPIEVTPLNKRKLKSEFADGIAEFNQSIPKRKRKKLSSDDDGCKRCNCKKTKCLKLYCDCFAAGIYCADSCSCQGCFNRPEYEDTVLETRQQIESRNPLAFAPKIVQEVSEFPAITGDNRSLLTTSAARHKRGCNCKKSMCLKKYCECYQVNVGCSIECRCEGCKNVFGRKGEYDMTEEMLSKGASEKILHGTFDNTLEMGTSSEGFELHDDHQRLTPLTPSFQCSNTGKNAPKSRVGRFVPSPESDLSMLSSYTRSLRGPVNVHNNDAIQERNKGIDLYSSGQQLDCDVVQMTNQFSPLGISDFSPLQNPSSVTAMSSASSKTRSWIQLRPGSGPLLPSGSLHWRSSLITPVVQSCETKIQESDSNIKLHNVVEDDTPEILKEESTPSTSVKVSSPNKKRVSPPHSDLLELRPTTPGGLKSGLKFILKSVPSFPPLTPCMHSEDCINKQK